jgi:hypothetical protein
LQAHPFLYGSTAWTNKLLPSQNLDDNSSVWQVSCVCSSPFSSQWSFENINGTKLFPYLKPY